MNSRHRASLKSILKSLSVTTNVVGLQTYDADHVDQNSSAHVARVIGLQTDAVIETHLNCTISASKKLFDALTIYISSK